MGPIAQSLLVCCVTAALALIVAGCASSHAEPSLVAAIRAEEPAGANEAVLPNALLEPPRPGNRQTVPVNGYPDSPAFATVARTPLIEGYPCSQCHNEPLSVVVAKRPKNEPLSHWQVKLNHANDSVMSCQTCHGNGNMDEMQTLSGKLVGFDAPYTVCAQCHGTQAKDWAGGAHGKRLDGWAGDRVVESCTGCHNPHAPEFESRWPAQLKRGVR